jgi:hypothetical protein
MSETSTSDQDITHALFVRGSVAALNGGDGVFADPRAGLAVDLAGRPRFDLIVMGITAFFLSSL